MVITDNSTSSKWDGGYSTDLGGNSGCNAASHWNIYCPSCALVWRGWMLEFLSWQPSYRGRQPTELSTALVNSTCVLWLGRFSAYWHISASAFFLIRQPIRDQFQTGLFWLWCSCASLSVVSTLYPALSHPQHHLIGYTQSQVTANQQWDLCTHTAHTHGREEKQFWREEELRRADGEQTYVSKVS